MSRLLLIVTFLLLPACTAAEMATAPDPNLVETGATVVYVPVEGGFYGILSDGGKKYDPMNLPVDLQKNGLRIAVKARIRKDVSSFRMWGEIVEILSVVPQPTPAE